MSTGKSMRKTEYRSSVFVVNSSFFLDMLSRYTLDLCTLCVPGNFLWIPGLAFRNHPHLNNMNRLGFAAISQTTVFAPMFFFF